MEFKDYQRYRWFFVSTNKLVVGGKSALQNEELIRRLKTTKKDFIGMHTADPGSPFAFILADKRLIKDIDIEECAIFTASFSRAWKEKKKKAEVHIFNLSQLFKTKMMKIGTWGVKPLIKKTVVNLELVLTKQKARLRAVPESTVKIKKDILLKIIPGKIDKQLILPKIQINLDEEFSQEELLSALPSGGIKIITK